MNLNPDGASGEEILIVDDNPNNLRVLSTVLAEQGYDVRIATNGQMALESVQSQPPDLIFLDIKMPDMDGYDVCRWLKQKETTRDVPVIFISALDDVLDKVKAFNVGCADYVTKPFQQEEVLARARVHLRLRQATQTLERQNEDLQQTLQQLKAAQAQIIANEKLASLGMLTAGIAHEICNPLNFVNNYAKVSVKLTETVFSDIERHSTPLSAATVDAVKALLNDIRGNLAAIHQHGQRAESIIRNMMQHARTGRIPYQLTNLNGVLAHAIQLVYHSIRAKNPDFNLKINADYDDVMGQLELAASDINRAFINIIENACYALQAKQVQTDETFTPTLWVKTSRRNSSVEIQIRDNGLGIEPEIQEKIFQPFFTTKPVGEGTGLGLSITHDIIVGQHQGTLSLATEPGNYTEFIITLPGNGASHTSPLS